MYGTAPFRPQCSFPALRHVSILALPTSLNLLCTVVVQREEEAKKEEEIVERKSDGPSNSSIHASCASVDEKKNEVENEKEVFRKENKVRGTKVLHVCPPLTSERTNHVKETDIHDAPNDFLSTSLFSSPLETIPKKQQDHMISALEEQESEKKTEMECDRNFLPFCGVPPTPTCSRISYHSSSFLFSYSFWTSGIYFEIHRPRHVPSSDLSRRRERKGKHVRDREEEEKEANAGRIDIHEEENDIAQEGGCVVLFRSAIRRHTAQPSWELPPSFLRSWRQERRRRGDTLPSSSPSAQPNEASRSTTTEKDFRFSSSTSSSSFSANQQQKEEEECARGLPTSLQFYSSMIGGRHSRRESRRMERVKRKHSLSPTTTTSSNAPPSLSRKTSDCRAESEAKKKEAIQKEQLHLVFYGILTDRHPVPPLVAFDSPLDSPQQQQPQQWDGCPANGEEGVGDGICSLCASGVRRGFPIWSVSLHPMDLTFLGTSLHASSAALLRPPLSPSQPSVLSLPQDTWKGEGKEEKRTEGSKTTPATSGTASVSSVTTIQTPTTKDKKNDRAEDEKEAVQPHIDPHPHHASASPLPRWRDGCDGRERRPYVRSPKCFYGCFLPFLPSSAARHPTAFLAPTIRLLLGYEKNDGHRIKQRDDNETPKWFTTSTRCASLPFLDISSAFLRSTTSSSPPPHFRSLQHHWRFWCATSLWHSLDATPKASNKSAARHTHTMKDVPSPPFSNGLSSPPMTGANVAEETNNGKGEEEKAMREKQHEWRQWLAGPSLLPPPPSPASLASPSLLARREGVVSPLSIRASTSSGMPTCLWNRHTYSYHFFPSFALRRTSLAPPLPYRSPTVKEDAVPLVPSSSSDAGGRLRFGGTVASWPSPSSSTMTVPLEAIWRRVAQRFFDASLLEMDAPRKKTGGHPSRRRKRGHGRERKKRETTPNHRSVQEKDDQRRKKKETVHIEEETSKGHANEEDEKREHEEKKICQERHCGSMSSILTSSFSFSQCKDMLWRRLQRSQENQAKWCASLAIVQKEEEKALAPRRDDSGTRKAGEGHPSLLLRQQQKETNAPRTSFGCASSSSPVPNPALVSAAPSFHRWESTYTNVLQQQLESSRRWLPVVRRQVVKEMSHIWFPLTFSTHYRILSPLTREDARAAVLPARAPPYADASRPPNDVEDGRQSTGGEERRAHREKARWQPRGRASLFSLFSSSSWSAEPRRHQDDSLLSTADASTDDFSRRGAAKDRIANLSLPCLPSWSTLVALVTATVMPASLPLSAATHEEGRKLSEKEMSAWRQGKHESDGASALVLPSSSLPTSLPIRSTIGRSLRPFSAVYHPPDEETVGTSMTHTRSRRPRTPILSTFAPSFGWHSSLLYPQDEKEFCEERQGLEKYCQALVQLAQVCHVPLPYPLLIGGGGVGVVIFAAPENWSCTAFQKEGEDRPSLLAPWREKKSASASPTPTATSLVLPTQKEDLSSSLLCSSCSSSSTVRHLEPLYLSGAPEWMPELIRMAQNGSSLSSFFLSPASCTSKHSDPNGCFTQGEMARKKNGAPSATIGGVEPHSGNVWRKADVSAIELEQQRLVFGRLLLLENGRALGKAIGVPDSVLSSCDSRLAALLQTLFRAAE